MVFTNNINTLVGALILLSHWNQDFYSVFNKNLDQKKTGLIFTQAYFFGGGDDDSKKKDKDDDSKKKDKKKKEAGEEYDFDSERLVATLSNEEKIPYIGLGLGNVEDANIPDLITAAFTSTSEDKNMNNLGYRLIDTGRVYGNEKLISETLARVISKNNENDPSAAAAPIHIVTKIWHTHLGYERTKISMEESLNDILGPLKERKFLNFKIHFLIHWPRCYEDEWTNCVEEENALPSYVKEAGETIPHENPFAFLGSWRAMEDMYNMHYPTIASIGVSNFDGGQLQMLLQAARIKPHIYQGNLEITDENLRYLRHHKIHSQLFGVLRSLTSERKVAKLDSARRQLVRLAGEISTEEREVYPASLLLSFLLKESLGVLVSTSKQDNLMQNSPKSLLQVPNEISAVQSDRLLHILESMRYHWTAEEVDEEKFAQADEKVHVSFQNRLPSESLINILFVGKDENGMEVQNMVAEEMVPADIVTIESHPGHTFKAYDAANGNEIAMFEVDAPYGTAQWFSVEL